MHAPLLPSAHLDLWPRQQLPPLAEWPVMRAEPPYVYPPRLNAVTRLLDDAIAEGHGDRIALVVADGYGGWEHVTYGELLHQVDALAQVLVQDLGLVPGNRVLLRGFNGRWMAAAWLATLKAGLVAVTTMPLLRAKELGVIIERAQVSAALCDARLVDELRQAVHGPLRADAIRCWGHRGEDSLEWLTAERAAPFEAVATSSDDVCLIAFTSGTTGVPKGCMHFHRDVLAMSDGFASQVLGLRADDRCIGTPPLAFTFGLGGLLTFPLAARACTVLVEKATPDSLLEAIAATRATVTFEGKEPFTFDFQFTELSVEPPPGSVKAHFHDHGAPKHGAADERPIPADRPGILAALDAAAAQARKDLEADKLGEMHGSADRIGKLAAALSKAGGGEGRLSKLATDLDAQGDAGNAAGVREVLNAIAKDIEAARK